jgi:hypothetical protein
MNDLKLYVLAGFIIIFIEIALLDFILARGLDQIVFMLK